MTTISTLKDFEHLIRIPEALRRKVAIIEPDSSIGQNPQGEPVVASQNIGFIVREIMGWEPILFQIWKSGVRKLDTIIPLAPLLRSSHTIIVEGGRASIYDKKSFDINPALPQEEFLSLIETLLLHRPRGSAPAFFICLGHQAVGEALVRLVRRAVDEIPKADDLDSPVKKDLHEVASRIHELGQELPIVREQGVIANGYRDARFAVAPNEQREVGVRELQPFQPPKNLPLPLLNAHQQIAAAESGLIEDLLRIEDFDITMLHGDEINQEAVLFANWALVEIHRAIQKHQFEVAKSSLAWLQQLPDGVEILCSTFIPDTSTLLTEIAATAIYYQDLKSGLTRRDFTLQFHPEILEDMRTFSGKTPSPRPLQASDGVRLLLSTLFYGLIES
ncbi:MAG: hypothetical protein ACFFDP_11145 [Promethearchaeota archaeon]